MHDGYLFILGICGSASGAGPAPACLDLMLGALPPVKRAAYLGEILADEGLPSLTDPLQAPLLADIADAELLLIVTPLPNGALPARLRALAQALEQAPPAAHRRFAALVSFTDGSTDPLWDLRHALDAAGIEILSELYAPAHRPVSTIADEALALARSAYVRARHAYPELR